MSLDELLTIPDVDSKIVHVVDNFERMYDDLQMPQKAAFMIIAMSCYERGEFAPHEVIRKMPPEIIRKASTAPRGMNRQQRPKWARNSVRDNDD
ncbi:MAG: hypothetical protein QM690_12385 [Sphingobium sp.]